MPLKTVDPAMSMAAKKSKSASPWHRKPKPFGATLEPRKLCADCYDALRSFLPSLSRVVQKPRTDLRCEDCGVVYSRKEDTPVIVRKRKAA